MNNEFDLDQYRGDFQQESIVNKKSAQSIQSMLSNSTLNNAKYILIISVVEFVLFLIFYAIELLTPAQVELTNQPLTIPKENLNSIDEFTFYYRIFYGVIGLVGLSFIISFYKIYNRLRVDSTIKQFTQDILKFRIRANYFIAFNIIMVIFFWVSATLFLGNQIQLIFESNQRELPDNAMKLLYGGSFSVFAVFMVIVFVYYRYFWGYFLGKLKKNQEELEELELEP